VCCVPAAFVGSCVGVGLLAALYEGLKLARDLLWLKERQILQNNKASWYVLRARAQGKARKGNRERGEKEGVWERREKGEKERGYMRGERRVRQRGDMGVEIEGGEDTVRVKYTR
jgi:hypothetical protein